MGEFKSVHGSTRSGEQGEAGKKLRQRQEGGVLGQDWAGGGQALEWKGREGARGRVFSFFSIS